MPSVHAVTTFHCGGVSCLVKVGGRPSASTVVSMSYFLPLRFTLHPLGDNYPGERERHSSISIHHNHAFWRAVCLIESAPDPDLVPGNRITGGHEHVMHDDAMPSRLDGTPIKLFLNAAWLEFQSEEKMERPEMAESRAQCRVLRMPAGRPAAERIPVKVGHHSHSHHRTRYDPRRKKEEGIHRI